eukprot:7452655-Pyramimonas_sp.AAC.1
MSEVASLPWAGTPRTEYTEPPLLPVVVDHVVRWVREVTAYQDASPWSCRDIVPRAGRCHPVS